MDITNQVLKTVNKGDTKYTLNGLRELFRAHRIEYGYELVEHTDMHKKYRFYVRIKNGKYVCINLIQSLTTQFWLIKNKNEVDWAIRWSTLTQ